MRKLLILIGLLICLLTLWTFAYWVGFVEGRREGRREMAKEVTKIIVNAGHKMATNSLPQRVK